jgi:hypothetical protein
MDDWSGKADERIKASAGGDTAALAYRQADAGTIRAVVQGISPSSGALRPQAAARLVFNLSCAHAPDLLAHDQASASLRPYKNRYDVAASRLGGALPAGPDPRADIDAALAPLAGAGSERDLYYGAVEINGAGVRFYGDLCLVLNTAAVDAAALVLDRNSFDLICAPLRDRTHTGPGGAWDPAAAQGEAANLAGRWGADLAEMAVCKVLDAGVFGARRLTAGAVSQGVLSDEDYLEVIRVGSFGAKDVDEARVGAADVAAEGHIADRLQRGPPPDWADLLWRHRRRQADRALNARGVRTRTVVSAGRVRA